MRTRLRRQFLLVAGATVIVAILTFGALMVTVVALERATETARRHERAATHAQQVGALVVDAETALRGFVLTGEERFLEPLEIAQREMPVRSGELLADAQTGEERRLADELTRRASAYFVDYALPTVDVARRSRLRAQSIVASEAGKRRVDEIRVRVAALVTRASAAAQARERSARDRGDAARRATLAAAVLIIIVFLLILRVIDRWVLRPVRDATDAAGRIEAGDLAARVPAGRPDEIGQLGRALNAMAARLQRSADELEAQHAEMESQNAELESQSVELETQALELERQSDALRTSNEQLSERGAELEAQSKQLEASNARVRLYAQVSEALAQAPGIEARAARLLDEVCDALDVPVGAVYSQVAEREACRLPLVAQRGLSAAPPTVDRAGDLAARAVRERRAVLASYPAATLSIESLGGRATVRHELHAPLLAADGELLGLLSIARTEDRPFSADERDLVGHLVAASSAALANALVSAQRAQQASMMRAVVDSVSEALLVVTTGSEVMLTNPPMETFARRLLELAPDEPWSVEELRERLKIEVRDRAAHDARAEFLLANPAALDRQTLELPRLGMWIHRYVAPVFGPSGELMGRIVVVRDITEERQAERAKDDLMATVSHELRTPLAAILGFAELLATRDFPEEERREYVDTVYQQSQRLSALLDDFLDLQRIERRGLDNVHAIDVAELVTEEARLYSAQSASHDVAVELGDGPLQVDGDAERLRRVVGNLLSNAIKYSPRGGAVRVEARRENGDVRLAVVDHGLGIPEPVRARVFDRFFRVDSAATARISGTGLGLALVRDIVTAHGGEVGVESVEGHGSRFWVRLPASEVPGDDASAR